MKNDKLNDSLYDSDDIEFLNEKTEPIFRQDIMIQKLDKKKSLGLSQEISNRKKLLNRMFDARFGKFFLDIKPESLIIFEKQLRKYFFSPNSKFLDNFPRLRKKLNLNNNINDNKLSSKINVGSLIYFSEANRKLMQNENIRTKEKIITFSKNFSTNYAKDIVNNEVYKVKFWDKNAKRINKLLSKKYQDKKNKNINNNNENEDEKKIDLLKYHSQQVKNNNFINKNLTRNIENEYFKNRKFSNYSYSFNYFINKKKNKENEKYIEDKSINNNTYNYTEPNINNNSQNNRTNSMINLNGNKISLMKSYLNNLKYYKHNINKYTKLNFTNNVKAESSYPSLTFNINDNSSHLNNNILKINNSYISRNDQRFKEAKNKLFKSTFHNTNKSIKELIESSIECKRNLTEKVKKLNKYTIKCNLKLCKLIDNINKKSKLKKKKIKNFDVKKDISDDSINNKNKVFNYYEYKKKLKSKTHKTISISNLLRETKKNLFLDNKILKKETKLFPKKILVLNDHYALTMVERLYSASKIDREKSPEDEEKVKEKKGIANNYKIVNLIKMNKINHDKIIKMGEVLIQGKDRLFKQNKKIQNII